MLNFKKFIRVIYTLSFAFLFSFSFELNAQNETAEVEEIVVTDTLKQNGNVEKIGNVNILSVSSIIATALTSIFADDSVSAIFMGENVL